MIRLKAPLVDWNVKLNMRVPTRVSIALDGLLKSGFLEVPSLMNPKKRVVIPETIQIASADDSASGSSSTRAATAPLPTLKEQRLKMRTPEAIDEYRCRICDELNVTLIYSLNCLKAQSCEVKVPHLFCETCKKGSNDSKQEFKMCPGCQTRREANDSDLRTLKVPKEIKEHIQLLLKARDIYERNSQVEAARKERDKRALLRELMSSQYDFTEDMSESEEEEAEAELWNELQQQDKANKTDDDDCGETLEEREERELREERKLIAQFNAEARRVFNAAFEQALKEYLRWGLKERRQNECHYCWRSFQNQSQRNEHIAYQHTRKFVYCPNKECNYFDTRQSHLDKHMRSSRCPTLDGKKIYPKIYECEKCHLKIRRPNEYQKHLKRCQRKVEPVIVLQDIFVQRKRELVRDKRISRRRIPKLLLR